jgi:hypothetical protein
MVNGILIRPEPIRASLLFGPPLQWRIAVNVSAPSQFVFLNALLKQSGYACTRTGEVA